MIKKLTMFLLIALISFQTACVSSTAYGPCVGVNGGEDSTLIYHGSVRNISLAVIFSELIIPPIKVVLDEYKCPVGRKPQPLPPLGPH